MNADHKYFIKKIWKHTDVYNYLMLQITNSAHSAYSAQWVGTCHFTHMSLAGDTGSDCSGMTCVLYEVLKSWVMTFWRYVGDILTL